MTPAKIGHDAGDRAGQRKFREVGARVILAMPRNAPQDGRMNDVHGIAGLAESLSRLIERAEVLREMLQQQEDDAPGYERLLDRVDHVERLASEKWEGLAEKVGVSAR